MVVVLTVEFRYERESMNQLEDEYEHFNIPVVEKHIEKYDNFALMHRNYTNKNISASKELNREYWISPVVLGDDSWRTEGMCYDNCDIHGDVIMSKDEMIMKFNLIFGKTVEYEIEMENDGWYSNEKINYMGKLRK